MNPYERYHRSQKVARLTAHLIGAWKNATPEEREEAGGSLLAYVRSFGPAQWELAARHAGVNAPSATSIAQVIEKIRRREARTTTTAA